MTKSEIRQKIWLTMQREGVARFPGTVGRIPNFAGAERAAQLGRVDVDQRGAALIAADQVVADDEPLEPLDEAVDRAGRRLRVAQVGEQREASVRREPELGDERVEASGIGPDQGQARAFAGERCGDHSAEAAGRTADHGHASIQGHGAHLSDSPWTLRGLRRDSLL